MAIRLFWLFFKIGLFCFGGGNAMISAFEKTLVYDNGFLTNTQFADMIAISQITPGPVAVNLATYVGAVMGETPIQSVFYGIMATLCISLPAFFFVVAVAKFFKEFGESQTVKRIMGGIRPCVIGLILSAVLLICRISIIRGVPDDGESLVSAVNFGALFICAASFLLVKKTKINPAVILLGSGIAGVFILY